MVSDTSFAQHDFGVAQSLIMAAATILSQGTLIKVSEHTNSLRERYVMLRSDGSLRYWASAPQTGEPEPEPRGGGFVMFAEEWWPHAPVKAAAPTAPGIITSVQQSWTEGLHAITKAPLQLGAKLQWHKTVDDLLSDRSYDGRAFRVRLRSQETFHLVAGSRAERRQWLTALQALVAAPLAAAPASETATGSNLLPPGDSPDAAASSRSDARRPPTMTATPQAILDELPEIWESWRRHGRAEAARERYAALVRAAPGCWQALQDRGNFFLHVGELRCAEGDFTSALELQPGRAALWNDRAACHIQDDNLESARSDLEEALRLQPNFAEALSNLGNVHRSLGMRDEAKRAYNAALILNPRDARTWNNRGALQEELGNLVAADLDLCRAVELGGCDKAAENRARIMSLLAQSEMELQALPPCRLVPYPCPGETARLARDTAQAWARGGAEERLADEAEPLPEGVSVSSGAFALPPGGIADVFRPSHDG